jgi:hypothetical protein
MTRQVTRIRHCAPTFASTQSLMKLKVGSSLNAGFISGSQRFNCGKENYKIPQPIIRKREQLRDVAERHGVDLRTAALQFSVTPDIASALVVGTASEQRRSLLTIAPCRSESPQSSGRS